MDEELVQQLRLAVAPGRFSTSLDDRIGYSRDQWPRGLLWIRQGEVARHLPDGVAWPADSAGLSRLLVTALRHNVPIIPIGGGSGVAGGTVPSRGGLVVDTKGFDRLEEVNPEDGWCLVGAGINGQQLELALNGQGLTLGHFPSSIYCSCVGGWLAARSAGQMSSRYGKIEDLVLAAELVLPQGQIVRISRDEDGPGWLQAMVGSEGTLGIFTRAWLRVSHLPAERCFSAWAFPSVAQGLEAIRRIMQAGLRPAVLRLYDPFDSWLAGPQDHQAIPARSIRSVIRRESGPRPRTSLVQAGLRLARTTVSRGLQHPRFLNQIAQFMPVDCLLVLVHEGEAELVAAQTAACADCCRLERGEDLGPGPAEHWYQRRYAVSFKQSKVYDAGGFVDTMEVATTWDRLMPLYLAVRQAIAPYGFVMAHFSHAYAEGCSIYFTFVGPGTGTGCEQHYLELWEAALTAAAQQGSTISHHHGVGELKASFMLREVGPAGRTLFSALKQTLDPSGGMNPGKLWPAGAMSTDGGHR